MKEVYEQILKNSEDKVIIIKNGIFYSVVNGDAYLFNYLFGYKVTTKDFNFDVSSFPVNSILKIKKKLKEKNIGYIINDSPIEIEIGDSIKYSNLLITSYNHYYKIKILNNILNNVDKIDIQELTELCKKWKI